MINFIQYTYSKDEELTLLSIESIFNSFKEEDIEKILIINDEMNSISDNIIQKLNSMSSKIKIINTIYDRKVNIRGFEHFLNYIKILKNELSKSRDDITVKIDPDTFIVNDNFIKEFNNGENYYMGDFAFSSWFAVGHLYVFRNSIIDGIWKGCLSHPCQDDDCPEDVEFGKRAIFEINNIDLSIETKDVKLRSIKNVKMQRYSEYGMFKIPINWNIDTFIKVHSDHVKQGLISTINVGSYSDNKISKRDQLKNAKEILSYIYEKRIM